MIVFYAVMTDRAFSDQVGRVVLVLSGKGGVGKSMVAHNLARALVNSGKKVGLLDIDLCGPSIPRLTGIEDQEVRKCPEGWVPIFAGPEGRREALRVMSIGFLLSNKDDPVIWRGPKKNSMITQLLTEVFWQDVDYLVVDTPPGTSDEIISVVEKVKAELGGSVSGPVSRFGGILVTTPQNASLADVRRQFTFCEKTGLPVIGLVENMAFFQCPHCSDCTKVFSSGGGESLSQLKNVPLLARVPIFPHVGEALDRGLSLDNKGDGTDPLLSAMDGVITELSTRWS